jgi:DNA-binding IclR family transcriptional regulator
MSSPDRLLSILQLFEDGQPVWTVEDIARALDASTSTTYRHVRSLVQAGFLDPVTGAGYVLGPAFIRYDRISRQNDEIIYFAVPVMRELLDETTQKATVILCRRFKDCVMCVHEEHGREPHAATSYERGVAMPMFLGATSKVILANLPERNLRSVYLNNEHKIRTAAGVRDWIDFKEQIRAIRRAGFAMTDSEVAEGRIGLAAPISRAGLVVAGISMVIVPSEKERASLLRRRSPCRGSGP